MKKWIMFLALSTLFFAISIQITYAKTSDVTIAPYTHTRETLQTITPEDALKRLIEGNKRFVNNKPLQRK